MAHNLSFVQCHVVCGISVYCIRTLCDIYKLYIDTSVKGLTVAIHDTGYDVPDQHILEPMFLRVDTAFASGGSATVSIGTDLASEPDDYLDDTAISGMTADAVIECLSDGSASSFDSNVTGSGVSLYYEVKTAALTAGSGWLFFRLFKIGE